MLKIGDFSRLSRISVKALRYYDEIGLLKPVEVDRFTGYRYYSADQLPRLYKIVVLKNLGLSLDEIGLLLTANLTIEQIRDLLHTKQAEIQHKLEEEETRLVRVEEWLNSIEKEGIMPTYDNVVMKEINPQTIVCLRDTIPAYTDVVRLWEELCPYLEEHKVAITGPPLAIYHDCEYMEKDVDVEVAVPIKGELPVTERIKVRQLPGEKQAACVIYQGPYENIGNAYTAMLAWIETNGYQIAGPDREVYLVGPDQNNDPSAWVTELQLPVDKK